MVITHSGFDLHKFSGFEIHATFFLRLLAAGGGMWYTTRRFQGEGVHHAPNPYENAIVRELIGSAKPHKRADISVVAEEGGFLFVPTIVLGI